MTKDAKASYAYLLKKNQERICTKDLAYCTYDEHQNPIPFCNEYPNDKSCSSNTIPPNILFMGCYADPSCGGEPTGKPSVSKDPPYAYTIDGKCERSSKYCAWLTDKVAIPKCAEDNNSPECRDASVGMLVDCYTEKTCGGNVIENDDNQQPIPIIDIDTDTTTPQEIIYPKTLDNTTILIIVLVAVGLLLIFVLVSFLVYKKHIHTLKKLHRRHSSKQRHQLNRHSSLKK